MTHGQRLRFNHCPSRIASQLAGRVGLPLQYPHKFLRKRLPSVVVPPATLRAGCARLPSKSLRAQSARRVLQGQVPKAARPRAVQTGFQSQEHQTKREECHSMSPWQVPRHAQHQKRQTVGGRLSEVRQPSASVAVVVSTKFSRETPRVWPSQRVSAKRRSSA